MLLLLKYYIPFLSALTRKCVHVDVSLGCHRRGDLLFVPPAGFVSLHRSAESAHVAVLLAGAGAGLARVHGVAGDRDAGRDQATVDEAGVCVQRWPLVVGNTIEIYGSLILLPSAPGGLKQVAFSHSFVKPSFLQRKYS